MGKHETDEQTSTRVEGSTPAPIGVRRITLPEAFEGRIFFGQACEDPLLELEAIAPGPNDSVVVISSGGCIALSLLAAGAGRVTAVDSNRSQNHLVELKAISVARLGTARTLALVGGAPAAEATRLAEYRAIRKDLSESARNYWDRNERAIRKGVVGSGVTEQFQGLLHRVMRTFVHPGARIERLLSCETVEEQRRLYDREWNSTRWRWLFALLFNRLFLTRLYRTDRLFRYVDNPDFATHFRAEFDRRVTDIPIKDNYFVHFLLTGHYATRQANGVPPFLREGTRLPLDRLELVDGTLTSHLRRRPAGSVHGFCLSNICEWLSPGELESLFDEIVRTAVPGARLCFRNFVGWTDVPQKHRDAVVIDEARGDAMIRRDRAYVQPRFVVGRIVLPGRT
jgi:S-adenosylmethionine-diacylglycerol 3-amino-3-carboxypropyl transferase